NSATEQPGIDGAPIGSNCWCRVVSEDGHLYNWFYVMNHGSQALCTGGAGQCGNVCVTLFRGRPGLTWALSGMPYRSQHFFDAGRVSPSLFSFPQQDLEFCENHRCGMVIRTNNISSHCINETGQYMSMIGC
ncbi:MAG: hypothetical protein FWC83_02510, partial [Alphaproteobacteria bacterium]|nr:hypothetical protein [Alphaproteobacteria bacterium]